MVTGDNRAAVVAELICERSALDRHGRDGPNPCHPGRPSEYPATVAVLEQDRRPGGGNVPAGGVVAGGQKLPLTGG